MADASRTVDIAINLTGLKDSDFTSLKNTFASIKDSVNSISENVTKFGNALSKLKVPAGFDKFSAGLNALSKVNGESIARTAEGLKILTTVNVNKVPNLDNFVKELSKLSTLTLPNVNGIASGLKKLGDGSIDLGTSFINLSLVRAELLKFNGISMPGLAGIAKGFDDLSKVTKGDFKSKTFTDFANALIKFKDIKVPNLDNFSKGLIGLSKFTNSSSVSTNMKAIGDAIRQFGEAKVPNINSLINGLNKLVALPIGPIAAKIKELNTALRDLDRRGDLASFKSFAKDLNSISTSLTNTINKVTNLGKAIQNTGSNTSTLSDRLKSITMSMGIINTLQAIKQGFLDGIGVVRDYDQALKDLQAITGATDAEVFQMGETIKGISGNSRYSLDEVANAMKVLGQAGFTASQSIQAIEGITNLATGTLSSMAETVDLVTSALNVFDIDASKTAQVADVFANAANKSKLTLESLRIAFNYVGPVAADVGITFEELNAAMMTLSNTGLRASTIGTGLRQVFAELVSPSDKLAAAARKAGVSLEELDPRTQGLAAVIDKLRAVSGDAASSFEIFGKRGASAVLALTAPNSQFTEFLANINETGSAAKMAAIQMEGLDFKWKNLKNQAGLLAISLGDGGLSGAAKGLISVLSGALKVMTSLAESGFGKLLISLSAIIVIAIPVVFAFGKIATSITFLKYVIMGLYTELGIMSGGLLFLVTAVTVVVASFVMARKSTEDLYNESQKLASSYAELQKTTANYSKEIEGLNPNSEEALNKNKQLRLELMKTASEMPNLSEASLKLADSINPLTGEFYNGEQGLKDYNEILKNLKFEELSNSLDLVSKKLHETNSNFKTFADYIEIIKGNGSKLQDAVDISKALDNGTLSAKELQKYLANISGTKLLDKEKEIQNAYRSLNVAASQFAANLVETGKVSLSSTISEITKVAEASGKTGITLDLVIEAIARMKKAKDSVSNSPTVFKLVDDPKELLKNAKESMDELKLIYAEAYKEIELNLLSGKISKADAVKQRVDLEKKEAQQIVDLWADAEAKIVVAGQAGSKEAIAASRALTASKLDAAKTEVSIARDKKEIVTVEKEHLKELEDLYNESSRKEIESNSKYAAESEKLRKDLADKLSSIEYDRVKKKIEYDKKELEDEKKLAQDIKSLRSSTEDKIRAVKQRGMSDAAKSADDQIAAETKLKEALDLVAQAASENDKSKLDRGKELLSQVEGLASGVADSGKAIDLLKSAGSGLEKALSVDSAIKKMDELGKKAQEEDDRIKKIKEATTTESDSQKALLSSHELEVRNIVAAKKIKLESIQETYAKSMGLEETRHANEMGNIDKEIAKAKEKLAVVQAIVNAAPNAPNVSNPSQGYANGGIVQKFASGGKVFPRLANAFISQGTPFVDSVRALLMKGEYIMKTSAVNKYGKEFFDSLNYGSGSVLAMANGGMVGGNPSNSTVNSDPTVNINFNLPISGNPIALKGSRTQVNELMRQLDQLKRLGQ